MSLYDDVITSLKQENLTKELYRFQGGNSFPFFDMTKNPIFNYRNERYTYFSMSVDHHYYFIKLRLRQFINQNILKDTPYRLKFHQNELHHLEEIKHLILTYPVDFSLKSLEFIYDQSFLELVTSNFSSNKKRKNNHEMVEQVDNGIYGGGFGVCTEWLDLLEYLTFFVIERDISRENMIKFLWSRKNSTLFSSYKKIKINEQIYNNFNKYNIMNTIEQILDSKTYLESSPLAKEPTKTLKKVLTSYQCTRDKTLFLLDEKYHHKI